MSKASDYNNINWREIVEISEDSPTRLKWKIKNLSPRQSKNKAGSLISHSNGKPHLVQLGYDSDIYLVHRIIWVMYYGFIDCNLVIDHIDGNPWNNKIENLRLVTQKINARNSAKRSNNKTNINGVCICKRERANGTEDVYVVAAWYDHGSTILKYKRKHFRVDSFKSEQAALLHAQQYLVEQQEKQKAFGVEYTERHGK